MEWKWNGLLSVHHSTTLDKNLASSKSCMHVKRQSVVCVLLLLFFFGGGGGGGLGKDHRARKLNGIL